MSMKYLGESFDIHTGGVDLIFPHHENEIAQSEASTGKHFVNAWLHNAHLVLSGIKMARRVGNISRPAEVYEDGYTPAMLRYALIATHYRAPLEWGDATMDHARSAVERLSTAVAALESYGQARDDDPTLNTAIEAARDRFRDAMDDDLNVSGGLGAVFELVRDLNSRVAERSLSTADAQKGCRRDPRLRSRTGGARGATGASGRCAGAARSPCLTSGHGVTSRSRTGCATSFPRWASSSRTPRWSALAVSRQVQRCLMTADRATSGLRAASPDVQIGAAEAPTGSTRRAPRARAGLPARVDLRERRAAGQGADLQAGVDIWGSRLRRANEPAAVSRPGRRRPTTPGRRSPAAERPTTP